MINYIERGRRLHEAVRNAGQWLKQENGEWVSSDDAAVQAIIDAFDPKAAALADKIATVKAEAQARIFAILPAWKQTNLLAQGLNNALAFGNDRANWPADQQAIAAAADIAWAKIVQIRLASNAIEAKLSAIADWQELEAHDAATDPDWPA